MTGPIALHGGGEFQPGDTPFLRHLLELAMASRRRASAEEPIRIAIVPTAAARGRPSLVGAHGVEAFEGAAASDGSLARRLQVRVDVIEIVDAATAADLTLAVSLADADVIHLPGGDPDLIPAILRGTPAWEAILSAHGRGAVLAGASAGAMALASWTWTPNGGVTGLGLVPGLIVVPHASAASWSGSIGRFRAGTPPGLGLLGIAERTGAISRSDDPGAWDVVGEGDIRWLAAGATTDRIVVVPTGERLRLPD